MSYDGVTKLQAYRDSRKAERDRLDHEIAKLQEQRSRLDAEVYALDHAIGLISQPVDSIEAPKTKNRHKRVTNKGVVLSLLENVAYEGASVNDIITKEPDLKRGTISSQLSHWKAEGIVVYHDGRYYLPEYAPVPDTYDTAHSEAVSAASENASSEDQQGGSSNDLDGLLN